LLITIPDIDLGFYKAGLKNVYRNFQSARQIQARIRNQEAGHSRSLSQAVQQNLISRSEFQLLARNWHDTKRIPIFVLIFIVCGEFTPLIVPFFPAAVPWTCRIPNQIAADRQKEEERRRVSFRDLTDLPGPNVPVEDLKRNQLLHISRSLSLHSRLWPEGLLPTDGMLKKRIMARMEYLRMDDSLIVKDGGVKDLEMEEVRMALTERGVDVLGPRDDELKSLLLAWIKESKKRGLEMILTRPSVWAERGRS
jgi:LETM1-like protein